MSRGSHVCRFFVLLRSLWPGSAIILRCFQYDFSELLLDKNKKLRKKGDKIKNEKYAKTLEKVQNDPESFYSGELANDIAEDIRIVNGIVELSDLRRYKSINRKPYKSELSGMNMYLTPPPTSGAVLALILNILKGGYCSPNLFFLILCTASSECGRWYQHKKIYIFKNI